MAEILTSLEIPTQVREGRLSIEIPRFRDDIIEEADIAEEIARVVGYDNIPLTLMKGELARGKLSETQQAVDALRANLCGQGLYESVTYSFTGPAAFDKLGLAADHPLRDCVRLVNPFGDDNSLMRSTPVVGMLPVLATNANRKINRCRFFELANVHKPSKNPECIPDQRQVLCLGLYGQGEDFYTLKGAVETLCEGLCVEQVSFAAGGESYYHPGRKAVLLIGGKEAGQLGEVHPAVCGAYDIPGRAYLAEIDVETLFAGRGLVKKFKPLPRYPAVERDLAVIVSEDTQAGDVAAAIERAAGKMFESVQLFDVYAGEHIEKGYKSLAYAIRLRAEDRTLGEEDVTRTMNKIMERLEKNFNARLRQ